MLLNDEERQSANHGDGAKVTHQNLVGVNKLLIGVEADTSRNSDTDGICNDDQSRACDVDEVI